MATWNRVANGSTAGNISMNVDIGIQSVTRTSNSNVRVVYGVRFSMATDVYTYNSVAAFCPKDSGNRYYAFKNGSGHTSSGTWYYANTSGGTTTGETCPFTIDIPVSITQTSASFEVGYGWNAHTPSQCGSSGITVNFPTGATAPTGCWCSASAVSETQINLSGGYGSDGGASITGTGFQYSTDQNNWYGCSSTFYGSANTTYYFRYYASNSQGTSYSGNASATTYNYPYCAEAPNFTIGNNVTIKLYNPLNRTVKIQMWSHVGQQFVSDLITITGTSYTGFSDVASRLYASIPNVKTSQYNIDVWYGDNKAIKIGGNYTIRGDENPTFGVENIIDVVDTLNVAITGDNTKFIKGHNTLTGVITPMSSNYGANLDYYSVSASGLATVIKTYSTSNQSFTLGNMVSNTFNVTAIDKRGMSRTAKIDIDLVAYNNPGVTTAKITRQNGIGTKAILAFTGVYTDWAGLLQTNNIQSIRYKIGSSGTWKSLPSDATLTSSGGVWTLNTILNDDFATTSQYDLYLEIKDLLETVVIGAYTISTADAFVWKDLANKRIGINKKPTKTLDVAGDVNIDGSVQIDGKFYQNEGRDRVLDTSDLGNYAFYKFPYPQPINNNSSIDKTLTITSKGRPVFISVCGDLNPLEASCWIQIKISRDGNELSYMICESHDISNNNPFCLNFLDIVGAGSHNYRLQIYIGGGSGTLTEDGGIHSPNYMVFEI